MVSDVTRGGPVSAAVTPLAVELDAVEGGEVAGLESDDQGLIVDWELTLTVASFAVEGVIVAEVFVNSAFADVVLGAPVLAMLVTGIVDFDAPWMVLIIAKVEAYGVAVVDEAVARVSDSVVMEVDAAAWAVVGISVLVF